MNAQNALTTTWVGGSVTPLVGLNSGAALCCHRGFYTDMSFILGFSMYEVDSETFEYTHLWWFCCSTIADVTRVVSWKPIRGSQM